MKKKLLILLASFIPLFSSCNRGSKEIKTICPLGAPSIVYYDQGNNENFVTTSATATILAQFQRSEYDAIVIDSTSGLKAIKNYPNSPYRFAKLLTESNLYLVTNKTDKDFDVTDQDKICAFGSEQSIPFLTFKHIYPNASDITRLDGITQVVAKLKNNPNEYDYYVLAEPALTNMMNIYPTLKSQQFKIDGGAITIPQAALFINKDTHISKANNFIDYLNNLNNRISKCIDDISLVTSTLNKYGDDSKVSQRFGLPNSTILTSVQSHNGLGITNKAFTYKDMNTFLEKIGSSERYSQDYFINI